MYIVDRCITTRFKLQYNIYRFSVNLSNDLNQVNQKINQHTKDFPVKLKSLKFFKPQKWS